jgi:segregation and condensation protein A
MLSTTADTFRLDNFEGPLDLLWHLINRQEIDIYQISLHEITQQFLSHVEKAAALHLDQGAEFISLAATLVWYKSKVLLPQHEQQSEQNSEEETDPNFEIIHHLIDYCRYKYAAKELAEREQFQSSFYPRGIEGAEVKKPLGIEHLTLEDLSALFQVILAKAAPRRGTIHEEEWKVSDKIAYLKSVINSAEAVPFTDVFHASMSREELIVTFLALLEMMKSGDAKVVIQKSTNTICIMGPSNG